MSWTPIFTNLQQGDGHNAMSFLPGLLNKVMFVTPVMVRILVVAIEKAAFAIYIVQIGVVAMLMSQHCRPQRV